MPTEVTQNNQQQLSPHHKQYQIQEIDDSEFSMMTVIALKTSFLKIDSNQKARDSFRELIIATNSW